MRKPRFPPSDRLTESLARFGAGLRELRLRRRMPLSYVAERTRISRSTIYRMERGDPGVAFGLYAEVLKSYGILDRLESLTDPRLDRIGLALESGRLPQRIRQPPRGDVAPEVSP